MPTTREELREIERRRRIEKEEGNRGGVIDLIGEARDAGEEEEEEEEVPAEVIDLRRQSSFVFSSEREHRGDYLLQRLVT